MQILTTSPPCLALSTAKSLQLSLLFYNTGLNCWLLKQLGYIDLTRVCVYVCVCVRVCERERACVCASQIVLLLTIRDNPI